MSWLAARLKNSLLVMRLGAVCVASVGIHKHQVDIGAVIQLLAAQLAQRDHREMGFAPVRFGPRHAVARDQILMDAFIGDFHQDVRQAGELRRDFGERAQCPAHPAPRCAEADAGGTWPAPADGEGREAARFRDAFAARPR